MTERPPDEKVASNLKSLADDWSTRFDDYVPSSSDAELKRRLVYAVVLCVGSVVIGLAIAVIALALD